MRAPGSSHAPVRYFLESLHVDLGDHAEIELDDFALIPLPRTDALARTLGTIPLRWPFEEVDLVRSRGWLVTTRGLPVGLLLDDGTHGLCFLDLTSIRGHGEADGAWERLKRAHLERLLAHCGAKKIEIDFPTKNFRMGWRTLRVGEHGPFEIPVFLDVYPPNSEFVVELLRCVIGEVTGTDRVLVIGSGAGPEAVFLASVAGLSVDAIDIGELEVANTRASASWNGVDENVRAWRSDGLQDVQATYDRIIFNAPLAYEQEFAAWNPRIMDPGSRLIHAVLGGLECRLAPRGAMYLMAFPERLRAVAASHQHIRFDSVGGGSQFRIYRVTRGGPSYSTADPY